MALRKIWDEDDTQECYVFTQTLYNPPIALPFKQQILFHKEGAHQCLYLWGYKLKWIRRYANDHIRRASQDLNLFLVRNYVPFLGRKQTEKEMWVVVEDYEGSHFPHFCTVFYYKKKARYDYKKYQQIIWNIKYSL